eukprot:TRINITY_DN5420_c0_g3_i4.p1 TRINITY_DN5420_c0_g3~~TRINITY_DN5420_c0_g3_i4.p1  ORF type:complete len:284 (-),score=25.18 TRINITY_DN5420_c0_g3_i4:204-1055(-)
MAAANGHLTVVDRLLQFPGVDATADNNLALRVAAKLGHVAVVDRLLQIPEVDATANNNQALLAAASFGHVAVVDRLLQVPTVDAASLDNQAISLAIYQGHAKVVARLLQVPTVAATFPGIQLLFLAIAHGHVAVVELLSRLSAVDANTFNLAIKMAIQKRQVAVVEKLLGDERAVLWLNLSEELSRDQGLRCAAAISRCASLVPSDGDGALTKEEMDSVKAFRKDLVSAFREAYECIRVEPYPGLATQLCHWMWPLPLARQGLEVQRDLRSALRQLQACRISK